MWSISNCWHSCGSRPGNAQANHSGSITGNSIDGIVNGKAIQARDGDGWIHHGEVIGLEPLLCADDI